MSKYGKVFKQKRNDLTLKNNIRKLNGLFLEYEKNKTSFQDKYLDGKVTVEESKDFDITLRKKLECNICYDMPRHGKIFGCRNGHHVCQSCHPFLKKCGLCNEPDIGCRQLFTEFVMETIMTNVEVKCQNSGCFIHGTSEVVKEHESLCIFREMTCPTTFTGVCHFKGTLRDLLKHFKDTKCCNVLILKEPAKMNQFEKISTFEITLCDIKSGGSIFEQEGVVCSYKGGFLGSKKTMIAGGACLFITRNGSGIWSIYVRILSTYEVAKEWSVCIEVTDFKRKDAPVFSYTGRPISNETSTLAAQQSGRVMVLNDSQVKMLKVGDNRHLFDCRIKVQMDGKFEEKQLTEKWNTEVIQF